jgi:curved DNA-binding protein CbpA
LSTAYDALKDPIRRKYYDTNREAILSGDDSLPSHGDYDYDDEDLSTEPTPMKLNKYFYYCDENFEREEFFKEFRAASMGGDGEKKASEETFPPENFYSIFSQLFTQLSSHELLAYQNLPNKEQKKASNSLKLSANSFGDASTSAEDILSFYHTWRNFSTLLSFEWTDLSSEQIADYYHTMLGEEAAYGLMTTASDGTMNYDDVTFNKSHRRHVKSEYNHRIQELLDLLERYDQRFQKAVQEIKLKQKEIKKLNRSKKYIDEKTPSSGVVGENLPSETTSATDGAEEEKIQTWHQTLLEQLRNSGGGSGNEETENQLSKTEKDKLKKVQSKVRNVFRKLMKLILTESTSAASSSSTATTTQQSTPVLPEIREDLESVLDRVVAYCPVSLLQEINQQVGGEIALKENSHLNLSRGVSLLNYSHHITQHYDRTTQLFHTREKILKKFPQRVGNASSSPSALHRIRWQTLQWTDREKVVLRSVYESIVTPYLTTATKTNDLSFFIPNKQLPLAASTGVGTNGSLSNAKDSILWSYLTVTINYLLWVTPLLSSSPSNPESEMERVDDVASVLKLMERGKDRLEEECCLFSEEEVRRALFHLLQI